MPKLTAVQKKQQAANIATFHFYMTTEVLKHAPDGNIGDIFGISEDVFVQELYEYTYLFCKKIDQAQSAGALFSEEMSIASADALADWFWGQVDRCNPVNYAKMPEFDEFELDITRVLEEFRIN